MIVPAWVDMAKLKEKAAKRRAALVAGGCSTYEVGWRKERERILCLCCGLGSYNTRDIKEHYCGFCQKYHSEWGEVEVMPDDARGELGYT